MGKTTLWVTKKLRNELMKLKFDTNKDTIDELLTEMITKYKKQKETQGDTDGGKK